jgi:hypothetical protein
MKKILLILSSSFSFMNAQLNYSGEINPLVMTRTFDQSQINLPFRILSLDLGYTVQSLDIKTVSVVEYRYDSSKSAYDLREAYFAYYPEWGEVKLGKQIHVWGAVDGNNPTDNMNPYDYYYLFKPGAGQKVGTLSFSSKLYFGNSQLEGIFIPKHEINRIPYGEKDYPLALPLEPKIEYPVQDEIEIGIRIQTSIGEADFGVSIFKGNDRIPSISTIKYYTSDTNIPDSYEMIIPQLGYRATTVWGLDFVTFIGDFTLRGEGALFKTQSSILELNLFKIPINLYELHQDIVYYQFVLQGEYTTASDIILGAQLIGNKVGEENYEWYHSYSKELVNFQKLDKFRPGMGTPFAMFSELALILSSSGVLMDDRLELKGNAMINLDKKGTMFSASVGYSPWMNWKFELGLVKFNGDKDDLESAFTKMEDFSHLRVGMFYNF